VIRDFSVRRAFECPPEADNLVQPKLQDSRDGKIVHRRANDEHVARLQFPNQAFRLLESSDADRSLSRLMQGHGIGKGLVDRRWRRVGEIAQPYGCHRIPRLDQRYQLVTERRANRRFSARTAIQAENGLDRH
jgi:hypothetical protein